MILRVDPILTSIILLAIWGSIELYHNSISYTCHFVNINGWLCEVNRDKKTGFKQINTCLKEGVLATGSPWKVDSMVKKDPSIVASIYKDIDKGKIPECRHDTAGLKRASSITEQKTFLPSV
jgi:hypothetical protein